MKSLIAIVGTKFRGPEIQALMKSLPKGEPLTLIREMQNEHDPNAVQVWARGQHIGYLKGTQNRETALRMDAGRNAADVVKLAIDGGKWPMAEIEDSQNG